MRILVTNDDGIDSIGLHVLARAMRIHGDVVIAAPDREYSGAGAAVGALHLMQPETRRQQVDGIDEAWSVTGPPALCVMFACLGLFGEPFDLVVAGINPGANVGRSVYHSGTVGAALTARSRGISGVAVSQSVTGFGVEGQGWDEMLLDQRWHTAAEVASVVVGALVARVVADPAFAADDPAAVAHLLALVAVAVVSMGLLQILLGLSGLVRFAKFVPQPVLAGFINGVTLLALLALLPLLFGWPVGTLRSGGWQALAGVQPATLAVGLLTVAVIVGLSHLKRNLPVTLIGLLAGTAAYALLHAVAPQAALGPLTGALPAAWPHVDRLAPFFDGMQGALLQGHVVAAVSAGLVMALIGTLELVLSSLAMDQVCHTRTDPRREVLALGAANVASGLVGGLPLLLLRARAAQAADGRPIARRPLHLLRPVCRAGAGGHAAAGAAAAGGAGRDDGQRLPDAVRPLVAATVVAMVARPAHGGTSVHTRRGGRRLRDHAGAGFPGRGGRRCRAVADALRPQHEPVAGARPLHGRGLAVTAHLR